MECKCKYEPSNTLRYNFGPSAVAKLPSLETDRRSGGNSEMYLGAEHIPPQLNSLSHVVLCGVVWCCVVCGIVVLCYVVVVLCGDSCVVLTG